MRNPWLLIPLVGALAASIAAHLLLRNRSWMPEPYKTRMTVACYVVFAFGLITIVSFSIAERA